MDATEMSFPDSTFDLVIDKGTYDALSVELMLTQCGDSGETLQKFTNEIVRVTAKGGCAIIITHGSPEKLMNIFKNYEWYKEVKAKCCRVNLSDLEQLINIMRIDLQGKPLKSAIGNKEYMMYIIKERIFVFKLSQDDKEGRRIIKV